MKLLPENVYVRAIALGAVTAIALNAPVIWLKLVETSPYAGFTVLNTLAGILDFLQPIPLLVAILAVPFAIILILFPGRRQRALKIGLFALIYIVIAIFCIRLTHTLHMEAFARLASRSAPLVDAIRAFETVNGHPPGHLSELVPEFLPEKPTTRMSRWPSYRYLVGTDAEKREGNPWVLLVSASSDLTSFDTFVYYPLGNYPEQGGGAVLERMGDWAYYHE